MPSFPQASSDAPLGQEAFTTHMPLREALAIVMLFSILMPSLYCLAPEREETLLLKLFLCSWILLPFVLALRALVWRSRTYGRYLLLVLLVLAAGAASSYGLSHLVFDGAIRNVFPFGILALLLFVAADAASLRRNMIRRRKAREENDISWVSQPTLLEEPRLITFTVFVLSYLWGLVLRSPMQCDLSLALAIAYLPLILSYGYQRGLGRYLSEMSSISNIPTRRIHLVGKAIVMILLGVLLVLTLPSFLARGLRPYTDIREFKVEYRPDPIGPEGMTLDMAGSDLAFLKELAGQGPYRETPRFLKALFVLLCTGAILALLRLVFLSIRGRFEEFRQTYDEGDVIIALTEEQTWPVKLRRKQREEAPVGERARIRRHYKRTIRKALSDPPQPHETPTALERRAGLADTPEGEQLHTTYEEARYAP